MPIRVTATLNEKAVSAQNTHVKATLNEVGVSRANTRIGGTVLEGLVSGAPPSYIDVTAFLAEAGVSLANTQVTAFMVEALVSTPPEEEIMRYETQRWDQIRVAAEVVSAGAGTTGLTVTIAIKRKSDGLWLQAGGTTWGAPFASHTASEVDATNLPGLYAFDMAAGAHSRTLGRNGYTVRITEPTAPLREHLVIGVHDQGDVWDEELADHLSDNTLGDSVFRMLALRQSNVLIVYDAWNSQRVPTHGTVYVYATKAELDTDVGAETPGAGAVGEYEINAEFNESLQLVTYYSTKEA